MAITAELVKKLREHTGAGMMDCKKALSETNGDFDAAIDVLRKKGMAAASKKSGRVAAEGLIGIATDGTNGAVVEVNAETDFVARNDIFQGFVSEVAKIALTTDEAGIMDTTMANGKTVSDTLTDNIATIGENQNFRRAKALKVNNGVVASYVHTPLADGLGKVGVLVALESMADTEQLHALGKQIAMHVAAAKPQFNTDADVDPAVIDKERTFLTEQALAEGKPVEIVEKMIDGRMRKFKEDIVLEHQLFIMDTDKKISQVVAEKAKELGADITITGFVNFVLGDGIEKKEENFAEEVAKTIGA